MYQFFVNVNPKQICLLLLLSGRCNELIHPDSWDDRETLAFPAAALRLEISPPEQEQSVERLADHVEMRLCCLNQALSARAAFDFETLVQSLK